MSVMKIGRSNRAAVIFCNESIHLGKGRRSNILRKSHSHIYPLKLGHLPQEFSRAVSGISNCSLIADQKWRHVGNKSSRRVRILSPPPDPEPTPPACRRNISAQPVVNRVRCGNAGPCCAVLPKFLYLAWCGRRRNRDSGETDLDFAGGGVRPTLAVAGEGFCTRVSKSGEI
jgi:hypothetical protein